MMRDTRTLKGLFPDPKPPRRKNFIKENVRSLRKMEQLFHTNDRSAKDLKLPVLKQTRNPTKTNGIGDNHFTETGCTQDEIERGIDNLILDQKSCHHNHDHRKKSAPVHSTKKYTPNKFSRPSVSGNVVKVNHGNRDHIERKNKNQMKIKAQSEEYITHKQQKEDPKNGVHKCKSQGVQTLDTNDIDDLYLEGVIRYPSGRAKEIEVLKPSDKGDVAEIETSEHHVETDDKVNSEHVHNDGVDYIKQNKERISLATKLAAQLNNQAPPPSYRYGVVPKYIKERKEALQKEQLAKIEAKQVNCPRGHVLVPDNERKETLSMLKKNYQEYVDELNMLPIKTDTLRSHRRKMEIEKQLTKLEEAIKIFSRPKVFVKVDS